MCFGGEGTGYSTMTIGSSDPNVTLEEKAKEYDIPTTDALTAPKPLDLGDEMMKAARRSKALREHMGRGRASTFLTGPSGDNSLLKLSTPSLLGG